MLWQPCPHAENNVFITGLLCSGSDNCNNTLCEFKKLPEVKKLEVIKKEEAAK